MYEMLHTLIEGLAGFTVRSLDFVDRQTDKFKDQALKQHYYLGRINNLAGYHCPNYFSRIGLVIQAMSK